MSKLLDELLSSNKSSIEQKNVFFNDDSPEGYTSQEIFAAFLRKQKTENPFMVDNVQKMFNNMSLNRTLPEEPVITNENGKETFWLRFRYGKVRQNLQIFNECGLFQFASDYANNKLKNVPNFEMLINSMKEV